MYSDKVKLRIKSKNGITKLTFIYYGVPFDWVNAIKNGLGQKIYLVGLT